MSGGYAPKSPDLSSLFSSADDSTDAPSPPYGYHQYQNTTNQNHRNHYQQQLPPQLHVNPPQDYYQSRQGSQGSHHNRSPSYSANSAEAGTPTTSSYIQPSSATSAYSPRFSNHQLHHYQYQHQHQHSQPHHQHQYYTPTSAVLPQTPGHHQSGYDLSSHQQVYPQPYADPSYSAPFHHSQQQEYSQNHQPFYNQEHHSADAQSPSQPDIKPEVKLDVKAEIHHDVKPEIKTEEDHKKMPPRRAAAQAPEPPTIEPSPVKTKFPTARIKRIMQADEDVGKVAQQTPIAVGKALELFMIQLVQRGAEVAKDKSSKRVTAQMLKTVVESDDQWDFLSEIISKVDTEEKAAKSGSRAKADADSESEEEPVEAPRKKGRGGGRKKKAAA